MRIKLRSLRIWNFGGESNNNSWAVDRTYKYAPKNIYLNSQTQKAYIHDYNDDEIVINLDRVVGYRFKRDD